MVREGDCKALTSALSGNGAVSRRAKQALCYVIEREINASKHVLWKSYAKITSAKTSKVLKSSLFICD